MPNAVFIRESECFTLLASEIAIANTLLTEGFTVTFVTPSNTDIAKALDSRIQWLTAPAWMRRYASSGAVCQSEILLTKGFCEPERLLGHVRRWQQVYDSLAPDIVFFNDAPTALVAAQSYCFKKIVCGSGANEPVAGRLCADLAPSAVKPLDRIAVSELTAVAAINTLNRELRVEDVGFVGDLYNVDHTLIFNLPGLDIYRRTRTDADYCLPEVVFASEPITRRNGTIVVYLERGHKRAGCLISALAELDVEVDWIVSQDIADQVGNHSKNTVSIMNDAIGIPKALHEYDLVVCDGSPMLSLSIAAGTSVLMAPQTLAERYHARLMEDKGVGRTLRLSDDVASIRDKIAGCMSDSTQRSVREIAAEHVLIAAANWPDGILNSLKVLDDI